MAENSKIALDSLDCGVPLFGILNRQGALWTPLAFPSEAAARAHIDQFWTSAPAARAAFLEGCKIVPVRARIEMLG